MSKYQALTQYSDGTEELDDEILNMSNPGDYSLMTMDPTFEIVKVETSCCFLK